MRGNFIIILVLYVDDIILSGNDVVGIKEVKIALSKEFRMVDLGLLHFILGIEVTRGVDYSFICQSKYASTILEIFGMKGCKSCGTPIDQNVNSPMRSFKEIALYRKKKLDP